MLYETSAVRWRTDWSLSDEMASAKLRERVNANYKRRRGLANPGVSNIGVYWAVRFLWGATRRGNTGQIGPDECQPYVRIEQ
jgi:hypothetical protein